MAEMTPADVERYAPVIAAWTGVTCDGHTYLSTSCHPAHHDHADCLRTCKHCSAPCVCAGHAADGDAPLRQTLPEIVAERDRLRAERDEWRDTATWHQRQHAAAVRTLQSIQEMP